MASAPTYTFIAQYVHILAQWLVCHAPRRLAHPAAPPHAVCRCDASPPAPLGRLPAVTGGAAATSASWVRVGENCGGAGHCRAGLLLLATAPPSTRAARRASQTASNAPPCAHGFAAAGAEGPSAAPRTIGGSEGLQGGTYGGDESTRAGPQVNN
eukprot:362874-Chlamydomonas_euryale.AAC.2